MKIIRLKISGGLGNQLFQAAFAYSVYKKYNNAVILIDKNWFLKGNSFEIERYFLLDQFEVDNFLKYDLNLDFQYKIIFFIQDLFLSVKNLLTKFLRRFAIFKKFESNICILLSLFGILTDTNRCYLNYKLSLSPAITISGYFQDIRYFDNLRSDILKIFKVKKAYIFNNNLNLINNSYKANTSYLIRLGHDHLNNSKVLSVSFDPQNFLQKSIKFFDDFNISSNPLFFSDEHEKLSSYINIEEKNVIKTNDPIIQLEIAKQSQYFVISNSSFAWWAYYLSHFSTKLVLRNDTWFSNYTNYSPGFSDSDFVVRISNKVNSGVAF